MSFDLDGTHASGKRGLRHLLGLGGWKFPQQVWPHINCTLLITGTIWDPALEPSPLRVPYIKAWSCPALREAKSCCVWMLWEDAGVPGSIVSKTYILNFVCHGPCGMASGWRGGITAG